MAIRIVCTEGAAVYVWQRGDNLDRVASRFDTTAAQIRAINTGRDFTQIRAGEMICVPTENLRCPGGATYEVEAGDTLSAIARKWNVTLGALLELNPYIDPDRLSIGQIICVPGSGEGDGGGACDVAGAACAEGTVQRTVRFGDTLARILDRYDVSYDVFRELNPSLDEQRLLPGQRYCVPDAPAQGSCTAQGAQAYTWEAGDTLATVAAKYRVSVADLLRLNPSLKPSEFTPGQVICVPAL